MTTYNNTQPHKFDGYNNVLNAFIHDKCAECGDRCIDVYYSPRFNAKLCSECNFNYQNGWEDLHETYR